MSHINTLWHHDNHIAEIRLIRPARSNALSFAMMEELIAAAEAFIDKPGLRAVILSGEGKSWIGSRNLLTKIMGLKHGSVRSIELRTKLKNHTSQH